MTAERNKKKKQNLRRNRRNRVECANKEGWKKHTDFHFQKTINGKLVDWWPSTNKCMIEHVVYRVLDVTDIHEIANIEIKGS